MLEFNYGAVCETVGIEIFEYIPIGALSQVNIGKKMTIIPDDPRLEMAIAFDWICENNAYNDDIKLA